MRRYIPLIVLLFVLFLDQGSKILVRDYFNPQSPVLAQDSELESDEILIPKSRPRSLPVFGNFFWITFHENQGVAFGFLSGLPTAVTVPLFTIIALLALFFIVKYYRSLPPESLTQRIALMGITGGALGNLIDRLIFGKVTDFFDLTIRTQGALPKNLWPIFNVADACIVVSVTILFIIMLLEKRKPVVDENQELPNT